MTPDDIRQELDKMQAAIVVLTDGKWDKQDVAAIATMLSAFAGLLLGGLALAMQLGLIGGPEQASPPDPIEEVGNVHAVGDVSV